MSVASTFTQNCSATNKKRRPLEGVDLPVSIDWRTKGVITPVKNQVSLYSRETFNGPLLRQNLGDP